MSAGRAFIYEGPTRAIFRSNPHYPGADSESPRTNIVGMPSYGPGHTPRLRGWDYSSPAWYFVSFATFQRRPCLATAEDGRFYLTPHGLVVAAAWLRLPARFSRIRLGALAIMPDQVHALVGMSGAGGGWALRPSTTKFSPMMAEPGMVLGKVIRSWKAGATWQIRHDGDELFRWQRGYHDRVVRDRSALARITTYIRNQ